MLTARRASLAAALSFALSAIESETCQHAPAIAKAIPFADQEKWSWGRVKSLGTQTRSQKPAIITVSRREASVARTPARMAAAARKKQMVVVKAQKSWPGGIQLGMKAGSAAKITTWTTPKEITQIP